LMHEIGHLLGHEHSDDGLMAPVLSTKYEGLGSEYEAPSRSSFVLQPSSLFGPSSFDLGPSRRVDDAFAELGDESESQDSHASELLESKPDGLLAAVAVHSSEAAAQARVPRRSRLDRFERELDDWFAELAAEEGDR